MLVNNPMGSRRRRRFYHRAGVVPIPGDVCKEHFIDPNFFNFEMEPFDYSEEEEFQPNFRFTQGGKRRVNYITVSSLHARLLEIIDSMIALAEAEDREKENEKEKNEITTENIDKGGEGSTEISQNTVKDIDQEVGSNGAQPSNSKTKTE